MIYLIGSLRNPEVPKIAAQLRAAGMEVFDDWFSAGEFADDAWRDYERGRGHSYDEALKRPAARNVFEFDRFHLHAAHGAVLVLPAGRSGHLEAGWVAGVGKPVFVLLDESGEPERLDVMNRFVNGVYSNVDQLVQAITEYPWPKFPQIPYLNQSDVIWLAGLWEGDGTFSTNEKGSVRVHVQMTDEDVVRRVAALLGTSVWTSGRKTAAGKTVFATGYSGLTGVEFMRRLMPYMGIRRQAQIRQGAERWLNNRKYRTQDRAWWERAFNLQKVA